MKPTLEFKAPRLELELAEKTHPDLRALLQDLGATCTRIAVAPPVVTCLGRAPEENAAVNGLPNSWHLCDCAADLRIWVWPSETVLPVVLTYLRGEIAKRGGKLKWGLLVHDVGSGRHVHIERRDASWRATYEKRPAP